MVAPTLLDPWVRPRNGMMWVDPRLRQRSPIVVCDPCDARHASPRLARFAVHVLNGIYLVFWQDKFPDKMEPSGCRRRISSVSAGRRGDPSAQFEGRFGKSWTPASEVHFS